MKRYSVSYARFVNENYSKSGIRFHYEGRTDNFEETIENYKNNRSAYGMRIVDSQTKEVVFEEIRPIKGILMITRNNGLDGKPYTHKERYVDLGYMREWEHRYMYGDFSKNVIKVEREIMENKTLVSGSFLEHLRVTVDIDRNTISRIVRWNKTDGLYIVYNNKKYFEYEFGSISDFIEMNLQDWCKLDTEDTRKINYTFLGFWDGKEHELHFTSEDVMSGSIRLRLVNSTIEDIKLENNEWYITTRYAE